MNLILASIGVFLGIILLLVVILLVAKQYLTPSGKVKITINGEKELEVEQGSTLLNTLSVNGIYLSSAYRWVQAFLCTHSGNSDDESENRPLPAVHRILPNADDAPL